MKKYNKKSSLLILVRLKLRTKVGFNKIFFVIYIFSYFRRQEKDPITENTHPSPLEMFGLQ